MKYFIYSLLALPLLTSCVVSQDYAYPPQAQVEVYPVQPMRHFHEHAVIEQDRMESREAHHHPYMNKYKDKNKHKHGRNHHNTRRPAPLESKSTANQHAHGHEIIVPSEAQENMHGHN